MFDSLSEKLQEIIKKTSGNASLTEENISDTLREVRRALLDADVSLKVVKLFMSSLREKALGEEVIKGVNPSQQFIKIVHDELVNVLGKENTPHLFFLQKFHVAVAHLRIFLFPSKTKTPVPVRHH